MIYICHILCVHAVYVIYICHTTRSILPQASGRNNVLITCICISNTHFSHWSALALLMGYECEIVPYKLKPKEGLHVQTSGECIGSYQACQYVADQTDHSLQISTTLSLLPKLRAWKARKPTQRPLLTNSWKRTLALIWILTTTWKSKAPIVMMTRLRCHLIFGKMLDCVQKKGES